MGLILCVAVMPVSTLNYGKQDVKVAKLKVSEFYSQACFTGGGIKFAEKILKDPILSREFLIDEKQAEGDFSGFECRWDSVKSRHGETVSLIIEAKELPVYSEVLAGIHRLTGSHQASHPISQDQLSFAWPPQQLKSEVTIRSESDSLLSRSKVYSNIVLMNMIGHYLMSQKVKTEHTDWGNYKQDFIANCDYIKFEDGLKMCISCTTAQRIALNEYLSSLEQSGKIVFGLHTAGAALITCMIHSYEGEHVHFIDGDNGGYSLAAAN